MGTGFRKRSCSNNKLARLEPLDETDQGSDREPEVARARGLHGVVTDAAAAAHEQHADRAEVRHRLPVMPRSRAEPQRFGPERADRLGKFVLDMRMARRGCDLAGRRDGEAEMAALGDLAGA